MDDDLQQLLAAGDHAAAFERLVDRFQDKVFRLAYTFLRDPTQAEDMTQDIMLRIWKGLPGYHGGASLATWIYAISRNACLTELKRRAQRPTLSLSDPRLEPHLDTLPALQYHDRPGGQNLDIQALLDRLPARYRQIIVLFYLEQKSYDEVAAMLALPLGTVKVLLFRGRKELLRLAARATATVNPPRL